MTAKQIENAAKWAKDCLNYDDDLLPELKESTIKAKRYLSLVKKAESKRDQYGMTKEVITKEGEYLSDLLNEIIYFGTNTMV